MEPLIEVGAIDNDRMLLEGLRAWISSTSEVRLADTAASVEEYLTRERPAQIVLLDLNLENYSDPVANVKALIDRGHEVIVVSVIPDLEYIISTTEAGAVAYVTKDQNLATLLEVIRSVNDGDSPVTREHAFWLSQDDRQSRPALSAQEKRVLEFYASGMTLDAAARRVGIKPGTAREYLARIKRKYAEVGRPIKNRVDYTERLREDRFGRGCLKTQVSSLCGRPESTTAPRAWSNQARGMNSGWPFVNRICHWCDGLAPESDARIHGRRHTFGITCACLPTVG